MAREGLAGNCLPFQNIVIFAGGGTDSGIGLFRARFCFVFCVASFPRTFMTVFIHNSHTGRRIIGCRGFLFQYFF